jgi:hypothetical protein
MTTAQQLELASEHHEGGRFEEALACYRQAVQWL